MSLLLVLGFCLYVLPFLLDAPGIYTFSVFQFDGLKQPSPEGAVALSEPIASWLSVGIYPLLVSCPDDTC